MIILESCKDDSVLASMEVWKFYYGKKGEEVSREVEQYQDSSINEIVGGKKEKELLSK